MYTNKIHYELDNALNVRIWLSGESLDDEAQLLIQFRKIGQGYCPILSFCNLSDGVDFDSLNEINQYVMAHKNKLELL